MISLSPITHLSYSCGNFSSMYFRILHLACSIGCDDISAAIDNFYTNIQMEKNIDLDAGNAIDMIYHHFDDSSPLTCFSFSFITSFMYSSISSFSNDTSTPLFSSNVLADLFVISLTLL